MPSTGEALDSWIESAAAHLSCPLGDLLDAIGLQRDLPARQTPAPWLVAVTTEQRESLQSACGKPADWDAHTFRSLDGRALRIGDTADEISLPANTLAKGSRYCPACLHESDGRWNLQWRFNWRFACLLHRCLLNEFCPACDSRQRLRLSPTHVPLPGVCPSPVIEATLSRRPKRCGTFLGNAPSIILGAKHAALQDQRFIFEIIQQGSINRGIYANFPQPAYQFLSDLFGITSALQRDFRTRGLNRWIVAPEFSFSLDPFETVQLKDRPILALHLRLALNIVQSGDARSAARVLRNLLGSGELSQLRHSAFRGSPGIYSAPVALALNQAIVDRPHSFGVHGLRLVADGIAMRNGVYARDRNVSSANLPSLLWDEWGQIFDSNAATWITISAAVAGLVLHTCTDLSFGAALTALGNTTSTELAHHVLPFQKKRSTNSENFREVVAMMAERLRHVHPPIDYDRRRAINYGTLLTETEWSQAIQFSPQLNPALYSSDIGRKFLLETMGLRPGLFHAHNRPLLYNLPAVLTAASREFLDGVTESFLYRNDVRSEPSTWSPAPLGKPWPTAFDQRSRDQLLHAIAAGCCSLEGLSRAVRLPIDKVRHELKRKPINARLLGSRSS